MKRISYFLIMVSISVVAVACGNTPSYSGSASTQTRVTRLKGWTDFTDGNQVRNLLIAGHELWAATWGGVVDWNLDTAAPFNWFFSNFLGARCFNIRHATTFEAVRDLS